MWILYNHNVYISKPLTSAVWKSANSSSFCTGLTTPPSRWWLSREPIGSLACITWRRCWYGGLSITFSLGLPLLLMVVVVAVVVVFVDCGISMNVGCVEVLDGQCLEGGVWNLWFAVCCWDGNRCCWLTEFAVALLSQRWLPLEVTPTRVVTWVEAYDEDEGEADTVALFAEGCPK